MPLRRMCRVHNAILYRIIRRVIIGDGTPQNSAITVISAKFRSHFIPVRKRDRNRAVMIYILDTLI